MIRTYLYNLGVVFSQFLSVIVGGHPDESISQRTGRAYLSGRTGYIRLQKNFIDFMIYLILQEKNHCVESLNGEAHAKEIWNWDKRK